MAQWQDMGVLYGGLFALFFFLWIVLAQIIFFSSWLQIQLLIATIFKRPIAYIVLVESTKFVSTFAVLLNWASLSVVGGDELYTP